MLQCKAPAIPCLTLGPTHPCTKCGTGLRPHRNPTGVTPILIGAYYIPGEVLENTLIPAGFNFQSNRDKDYCQVSCLCNPLGGVSAKGKSNAERVRFSGKRSLTEKELLEQRSDGEESRAGICRKHCRLMEGQTKWVGSLRGSRRRGPLDRGHHSWD